jgi:hypothetical protein
MAEAARRVKRITHPHGDREVPADATTSLEIESASNLISVWFGR